MVSKNRPNPYYISIPADWGKPEFHLAKLEKITTVLPNTTRSKTGEFY